MLQSRLGNVARNIKGGLHGAAFVLALGTFTAQLLGLLRDRLLAQSFGAGPELDLYYAAFRVPDLIYISLGSLLAVTVLVPFVLREKDPRPLLDAVFTSYVFLVGGAALVVWVFMPSLAAMIAPGFSPDQLVRLVSLSRVLLLSPVILGLSPLLASILQTRNKFGAYAFAPAFYNLGIILGIVFLAPRMGIRGVVYGVVFGVMLHVGIQLFEAVRTGSVPRLSLAAPFQKVGEVVKVSIPRTLTLGVTQFLVIVVTALASRLGEGSISTFSFALTLASIPQALLGLSYATVSFPTLTRQWQEGDRAGFRRELARVVRVVTVLSVAVSLGVWLLKDIIVSVLLGAGVGRFSVEDATLVSGLLGILAITVTPQGLISLLSRGFFAMTNTRWPLAANLVAGALSLVLMFMFGGYGIDFLALAYSTGLVLNGVILVAFMEYRLPGFLRGVLGLPS